MRIVKRVLSTYSADNFGVCSALYELGGLVVMHDASGCNSTYNTHDEPRWYDMDSMVFISGLTEKDAIFGNDEVLVRNLCETADKLKPKFVCVCGGPLPHIIGTDFRAVAKSVSRRTGLPTFGIQTNGMDSYLSGAGEALACLVDMMSEPERKIGGDKIAVNLLGATPLDFSLNGSVQAIEELLRENGFQVRSTWAMGDTLENILTSADADVNLVISATGYPAARRMQERFGIPFVTGCPVGRRNAERICSKIREAASRADRPERTAADEVESRNGAIEKERRETILLIGEPVMMKSLAEEIGGGIDIICPMRGVPREITAGTREIVLEDELREACRAADLVIADPLYARLLPAEPDKFIALPHVAYSGRYYEKEIPVLVGAKLNEWLWQVGVR